LVLTGEGKAVRRCADVAIGDAVSIRLHSGSLSAQITEQAPPDPSKES
jgi:hypothetical protein